ncbi:MAG: hypothetical protein ACRDJW_01290 [Thermomicrobiales bacterium]
MPRDEYQFGRGPTPEGPLHPIMLPPELADFLRDQDLTALFHASDTGTLVVVKVPSVDLVTLRGPVPIALVHELYDHPRSPVVRTRFGALAQQEQIAPLFYDELLRHRLSKRLRNRTAEQIPQLLTTANRLLAAIPANQRDFDHAKAEAMEVTSR